MGLVSNKIQKEELNAGDHIYSWRSAYIYAHHGLLSVSSSSSCCFDRLCWMCIYVGDEMVIHFTRGTGQEVGTGTVLDHVIFSSSSPREAPCGDLYLFQYNVSIAFFVAKARGGTCTLADSDHPVEVLHRASYLLENGFGVYHIFKNNCEDFAIYCKTGLLVITSISVGRSGQASSFLAATAAIVSSPLRFLTTSVSGLMAVAGGMYCVSRFVSDVGIRRDVQKVAVEELVSNAVIGERQPSTGNQEE
ncbi:hypothetical protein Sjap_022324 [Stephania japonica]|uniref:LRAT domain-containing protein n=1 Tax=Stephania japonica TaxID=461633 RepID=A0AAP0EU17_9MAGN